MRSGLLAGFGDIELLKINAEGGEVEVLSTSVTPMTTPAVTVIVPTIGDQVRARTIWRAIESAGPACGVRTRILVVVNGRRYSDALVRDLAASPAVELVQIEQAGMPLALHEGRRRVATEFFAFLDDDDEFLPGALRLRSDILRGDGELACVITNGQEVLGENRRPIVELSAEAIEAQPLESLLRSNWFATSASGLYRSSMISTDEVATIPAYLEWTYLGFLLTSSRKVRYVDSITYTHYSTEGSVSKSFSYRKGGVDALEKILSLELPRHIKRGLTQRLADTHHCIAEEYRANRQYGLALRSHLKSMLLGGAKYGLYSRKLIGIP